MISVRISFTAKQQDLWIYQSSHIGEWSAENIVNRWDWSEHMRLRSEQTGDWGWNCEMKMFVILHCIVLYCIALYCIILYYIVLYCIVLYCIVLYCIVLYCIVLNQIDSTWLDSARLKSESDMEFENMVGITLTNFSPSEDSKQLFPLIRSLDRSQWNHFWHEIVFKSKIRHILFGGISY
jgi:hypothetical protein